MSIFPPEYIDFIAKGIVDNLRPEGIEKKEHYTEADLLVIFDCKTNSELYAKLNEIEEKTVQALGLPVKESYSVNELSEHLNLSSEMISEMNDILEKYPDSNH